MIVDTMTGDNSDTTLTLSVAPVSVNNVQVYFDGVYQNKANYSISGTTLTFSTAPATGVAVEAITHTQTTINEPANGTVTSAKLSGDLTTPGNLDVTGTMQSSGTVLATSAALVNSTSAGGFGFSSNNTAFYSFGADTSTAGSYTFQNLSSDASVNITALKIDSSGNVGIGVTPSAWAASSNALQVGSYAGLSRNDALGAGDLFYNAYMTTAASDSWSRLITNASTRIHQRDGSIQFKYAASGTAGTAITWSEAMRIDASGNVFIPSVWSTVAAASGNVAVDSSGQLYRESSSIRYKTNVETMEDTYADEILNLRPVFYRGTCELDNPLHGHWGFIAEEVSEIDPRLTVYQFDEAYEITPAIEAVEATEDSEEVVAVPAVMGRRLLDKPIPEGVKYAQITVPLINIVKRHRDEIAELKATLSSALARIEALEGA